MSAFKPAWPLGLGINDEILAAALNALDQDHVKAPNFVDGGATYSPAVQVIFGGAAGLLFNCPVGGTWATPTTIVVAGPSGIQFSAPTRFAVTSDPHVASGVTFTVDAGAALVLAATATFAITGAFNVLKGGSGQFQAGTELEFKTGSILACDIGSNANFHGASNFDALTMVGSAKIALGARSITRVGEMPPIANTGWQINDNGTAINLLTGVGLSIPLHFPEGAVVTAITIRFVAAAGHGGVLPKTMPTVQVFQVADGDVVQIGPTVTDPSPTAAAYEQKHSITVPLQNAIERSTARYYATLSAEQNGSAKPDALYLENRVTYTPSSYDED